jgi:benzil reductase ((S)-benzoin forming)
MHETKAIVTGHSRGLGAAIADSLTARGIAVLGLARSAAPAGASPLLTQSALDLASTDALAAWLATPALHDYLAGSAQVLLINNAGMVQPVGALSQQDPLAVAAAATLNVAAPLMLAAAVVAARKGKPCRVLHVSSGAASSAYPGWSVYCASKAALDHHARAVALDAQPGVRICSLAPGIIDTDMQALIRATPEQQFPMRQRFVDMQRQGQLSTPAACAARLVDYLLSDTFGKLAVDDLRHY